MEAGAVHCADSQMPLAVLGKKRIFQLQFLCIVTVREVCAPEMKKVAEKSLASADRETGGYERRVREKEES